MPQLGGVERRPFDIARPEPRLGDIEAAIRLEAPGVETDRKIVGEKIGAGEI